MTRTVQLIIPAAGLGNRLARPQPKALVPIAGVALLVRTLRAFEAAGLMDEAIVVYPAGFLDNFRESLEQAFPRNHFHLIEGGAERQDSVRNALAALDSGVDWVVLHDCARPFVSEPIIGAALAAARAHGGATVAIPSIDTILQVDSSEMLYLTPDRSRLWACQTPQIFAAEAFRAAHAKAHADSACFTDDASLFKHYGGTVKIVRGSAENRKITTEDDLQYAEFVMKSRRSKS